MGKLHSRQDVYVNDVLTWEKAAIVEDQRRHLLRVSAGGRIVATYTDTTYVGRQGTIVTWTGLDGNGTEVTVAGASRATGCSKCRGR